MTQTELYTRYAELDLKARWEPLSVEEEKECNDLIDEIGLEGCDNCQGEGGRSFPSPAGGWEYLDCKCCKGTGFVNCPDELIEAMK